MLRPKPRIFLRNNYLCSKGYTRVFNVYSLNKFHTQSLQRQSHVNQLSQSQIKSIDGSDNVPWYLREESDIPGSQECSLPELPENSPQTLETLIRYMITELGLEDVVVVDFRQRFPLSSFGPNAIMVVSSAKTDRHVRKAGVTLQKWLKHEFKSKCTVEGFLTSTFIKTHTRRLKKKARKYAGNDEDRREDSVTEMLRKGNKTDEWIILDTGVDDIHIHVFIPEKRDDVDIVRFWQNEQQDVLDQLGREIARQEEHQNGKRSFTNRFANNYTVPKRWYSTKAVDIPVSSLYAQLKEFTSEGHYKEAVKISSQLELIGREDADWRSDVLKAHINYLSKWQDSFEHTKGRVPWNQDVVSSLILCFPTDPSPLHLRLRLIFLQRYHFLNPDRYTLDDLLQHAVYQQACGVPLQDWDLELLVTTIAYSRQWDEYSTLTGRRHSKNYTIGLSPVSVVNRKLKLIDELYQLAFLPQGKAFSVNDNLIALLYRLYFAPSDSAFSTQEAVLDPTSDPNDTRSYVDPRAFSVLKLLDVMECSKSMIALVLTSLANAKVWTKFWDIWRQISIKAKLDPEIMAVMIAVVVKSGDRSQIETLLDQQIPEIIIPNPSLLSQDVRRSVEEALLTVDTLNTGYKDIRGLLDAPK